MSKSLTTLVVAMCLIITSCAQKIPKDALSLQPESLQLRQLQTRQFDTHDEKKVLSACAGVLQDLGFTIDDSETKLGFIGGSKLRDATNGGQVAGMLFAAFFLHTQLAIDKDQKIRVSIVTIPQGKQSIAVRVTFQRILQDTQGGVRVDSIEDANVYQEFFDKLSKSVFLTAHEI